MDVAIAFSVMAVIVGLVVPALRLDLPPTYETPVAIGLGVLISLGYALAAQLPGGALFAHALLRGVAVGLTSAGVMAAVRRVTVEKWVSRR